MDKQQAQAFREQWQAVADVEKYELQQASIAERWRQFNAILQMAVALGLPFPQDDLADIVAIRQRWTRLQEALL